MPKLQQYLFVVGNYKMTPPKLFLAVLFGLCSCGQSTENIRTPANTSSKNVTTSQTIAMEKELWTLYDKSDKVYHVKRLLLIGDQYWLLTYNINAALPEQAHQTFVSKQRVNQPDLDKLKSESSAKSWEPFETTPALFVQLQYTPFKDQMEALERRQEIEQLINDELKSQHLGSEIRADIGPGGANMMFEVQDVERAKAVVLRILAKEGLDKATIIGRSVNTTENDWFYEVVYPIDFNGEFLTM